MFQTTIKITKDNTFNVTESTRYNFEVVFRPGSEIPVADTL